MLPDSLGFYLLVAMVVMVTAAVLYLRARPKTPPPRRATASRRNLFAAVELVPGAKSCAQAKELSLQALLATDAPALPLEGCTKQCRCRFVKQDADRRQDNRRRTDDGLPEEFIYAGAENRTGESRRS